MIIQKYSTPISTDINLKNISHSINTNDTVQCVWIKSGPPKQSAIIQKNLDKQIKHINKKWHIIDNVNFINI